VKKTLRALRLCVKSFLGEEVIARKKTTPRRQERQEKKNRVLCDFA